MSHKNDHNPTRKGVERTAKLYREAVIKSGGKDPGFSAAKDRVARAVTRGNLRRANNNR